jgi:type I restriction enzyme S subunit
VKFGDVVQLYSEHSHHPAADGIERYVGIADIEPEDLRIRSWGLVAEGTSFTRRFKPGHVLFVKRRAYQRKVAVANFEGVCSGDIYVLEPKNDRLLPELLPFICQTDAFFAHAVNTSAGSLSPRTNWKRLTQYEFAVPSLAEQRRIARVLQANLNLLENTRLALDAAEVCLDSVREHLFAVERTKKIILSRILQDIEAGKSVVGTNEPPVKEEYGVLKVSAVGANGFCPEESKTLVRQEEFLPEYAVKSGDLLVTRANTPDLVGMACYVEQDYPNLMLCDKTLRLIPKPGIDPQLLREALWTRSIRQQIKSMATGTGAAMKNLSQAKFRKLEVCLPADTSCTSPVLIRMLQVTDKVKALQRRLADTQLVYQSIVNEFF